MWTAGLAIAAAFLIVLVLAAILFVRRAMYWGSTPEERAARMTGDGFFTGHGSAYVAMTRAIDVDSTPETVWPWLAQIGRGAGWYSFDRVDNGGKPSARHIVSWIPEPEQGDATAIGYLRSVVPGRELTWWAPGVRFAGAEASLAVDIRLGTRDGGSRVVLRYSADATGAMAWPALWIFQLMDCIMATRQIAGIKMRAEGHADRPVDPQCSETGDPAQYQLYEVIYASGERAGTRGREKAEHWRRIAGEAGML